MCSNFQPVRTAERMKRFLASTEAPPECPAETWPGYLAPYICRDLDAPSHAFERQLRMGQFGMVPSWAKDTKIGRQTYNSRSETAADKPSFRQAWRRGQRAIIPVECVFEPFYDGQEAKPVRWKISHVDDQPLGIAGLWEWCPTLRVESFTMLTVNADQHPLMNRFHKPGEEKRMVTILDPTDYDRWLDCPVGDMPSMMTRYPAHLLQAMPAGVPDQRRKRQVTDAATPELDLGLD